MLSTEIADKLKNLKYFLGVFARDTLPAPSQKFPLSLVANTDTHDQPGTHWVCIYIDENGEGEYFDSYGLRPLQAEFINYLYENCENGFSWNKITLQCTTCVTCGEYCCAYLLLRTIGYSYHDFIKLFTNNKITNDIIIKNIFSALT